ncbi:hypothetical protein FNH05_35745 [Amycolatopsis rhizosphaerae]|uniref:WXG100 family type VII secretion target n=1 Tax=Amycolatopsis rhizosphaerae TaxID=2053003 RepID=A0A558A199_9PSEU|nr:hypothetical protein [Amycolatopsis rhizosphaerae]TVT18043.1 hypothetical protein FNH05_35745 [Amycolatopsis rhizosphaerae]
MPGEGFHVDVDALKEAGLGLSDLLGSLDELEVEDIDCERTFLGHKGLADSYESFTSRWQAGVANLTKDGQQLSRRLINAAGAYIEIDQAHQHTLNGLLDGGGADPAVESME